MKVPGIRRQSREQKAFRSPLKVGARVSKTVRDRGLIARAMPHRHILCFAPQPVTRKEEVERTSRSPKKAVR